MILNEHAQSQILVRTSHDLLDPEIDDLLVEDVEPHLFQILVSDEDEERRFAAAAVLAEQAE